MSEFEYWFGFIIIIIVFLIMLGLVIKYKIKHMTLEDNLLDSSISISFLRKWLDEQEKGGARYIGLRVNDISTEDPEEFNEEIMDDAIVLKSIQLEAQ